MTPRERQTSGGPGPALVEIPKGQGTPFPLLAAALAPPPGEGESYWEDVFSSVSSTQQKHLIELARSQGLLHECRFPDLRVSAESSGRSESLRFQLLSHLLQGKTESLEPISHPAVPFLDAELDEGQQSAVVRALHTPDICLIQGQAGTGKSRVAAEIITQAAAQGQRVLLLAQTPAAIDRVLEMVAGREQIYALRCLGRDESLDRLPAPARALTFAERSRVLRQRALESARQTQHDTEQRLLRHSQEKTLWPRLLELCEQFGTHRQEFTRLEELANRLPLEAEQKVKEVLSGEAALSGSNGDIPGHDANRDFLSRLAARRLQHQEQNKRRLETQTQLNGQREELAGQLGELTSQVNALRPLALARKQRQWWKPAWWRARSDTVGRFSELEEKRQTLEASLALVEGELAAARSAEELDRQQLIEDLQELQRRHVAEQQEQLAQQIRVVQEKMEPLREQWRQQVSQLQESLRPRDITPEEVLAARQNWEQQCAQEEEKGRFLSQWLDYVEEFSDMLARRLPRLVNVVAATVRSLQDDEHFGTPHADRLFDLLVLDESHLVSEPDLLKAARRANRWVLIGEPSWEPPDQGGQRSGDRSQQRSGHAPRSAPAKPLRSAGSFQRLWGHLHCDPSKTSRDWYFAGDRLCCRLQTTPSGWKDYLESEPVADRPDIELRICSPPRERPFLAEVLFPGQAPLHEARQYIYQELQEVAIRTSSRQLRWREEEDRVVLQLTDALPSESVPLADGVTERLSSASPAGPKPGRHLPRTAALEFARDQGWNVARARDWVEKHLHWRDLGRTALLERVHRMSLPLAVALEKLLYNKSRRAHENGYLSPAPDNLAPIEFIPIPPVTEKRQRPRKEEGGSGHSRNTGATIGGAGLEQDLSKVGMNLPEELRGLPPRGVINLQEARAVIHMLEELVADPALRQAAQAQRLSTSCPVIAVIALYPAQAELIRRLSHQSTLLAQCQVPIEVGLPTTFRQRECLVALISLTRSQGHRAVCYSESSESLPLALTRSRQRMILFGDAGQLARRSQWRGPLDHLDEATAALERRWADQLLKHFQGQGQ